MTNSKTSQFVELAAVQETQPIGARTSQLFALVAYAPPEAKFSRTSDITRLTAYSTQTKGNLNRTSQLTQLVAYRTGIPNPQRQAAWTFIMDGHRFYVLPLGPEGDWAYDTTTQEWCQLQSQGFPGLNFTHGVMWGMRVVGGDALYTFLYEMDPNQPFDEGWREVQHMVTGGVATRSRAAIGVANFTVTASVGDESATDQAITLAFSDDNGFTWSDEMPMQLTDVTNQKLIWNALGSFAAPGRVFRITDYSGPIRLDGADVVLTLGTGADSGIADDGDKGP